MHIEVNPAGDRAVYRQIADQLRSAIESGELVDGDRVPSETELMEMTGVARMTVRQGLQILQNERLLVAEHGRGVFVRKRPPVIRLAGQRFAVGSRSQAGGAFAAEAERLGLPWREELRSVETVKPSAEIAARLGVAARSKVVARRRRMWLDGRPVQLADSYFPYVIVRGSRIMEELTGVGGSYSRLEDLGHVLDRAVEEISVRMASGSEQELLHISSGTPVVRLVRTVWDAEGRAVEVFDSICLSEVYVFAYDVPLR